MSRALLLVAILDLTLTTTATGNPARVTDRHTGVRSIDWLNRAYTVKLGSRSYGPITVKQGRASFRLLDNDTIAQTKNSAGWYRVDKPRYLDVNGDGVEDVLITGAVSFGGGGFKGFTTADVYTLRRGAVVRLATIDASDITDVATCKGNILIERDHYSYWNYYWTNNKLQNEPADDCASPGRCRHLCVNP